MYRAISPSFFHGAAVLGASGFGVALAQAQPAPRIVCEPQWVSGPFTLSGVGDFYYYSEQVRTMAVFDDGRGPALYLGGRISRAGHLAVNNIVRFNGTTFEPLSDGVWHDVFAMTAFDDGAGAALYVGGSISQVGCLRTSGVGKWDGETWSTLDAGIEGAVYSLVGFDDGTGPTLFAGGSFPTAGGVRVNNVAKWDGVAWRPLVDPFSGDVGVDGAVAAMTVFDDGAGPALYVAGSFTEAGSVTANRIARWNGVRWSPLGTGVDGPTNAFVRVMTTFNDAGRTSLFVGGRFSSAGAVDAANIARWDGIGWSPLSDGSRREITAMTVHDDGGGPGLYVNGASYSTGGPPFGPFIRWRGGRWSTLPSPDHMLEFALISFDDGSGPALFAAGYSGIPGQTVLNGAARWDGSNWLPLGGGLRHPNSMYGPDVEDFLVWDDGAGPALYVAGAFESAGGVTANNVAKWDGRRWFTLGDGTNDRVYALHVHDDGTGPALYAGGRFTTAGGRAARKVARWDGREWSEAGRWWTAEPSVVYSLETVEGRFGPGRTLCAGGNDKVVCLTNGLWAHVSGLTGTAYDLAIVDDGSCPTLYAAGAFTLPGGAVTNVVSLSCPSNIWLPVGPGLNSPQGRVSRLIEFDDGSGRALFACGDFRMNNRNAFVARWDGVSWSPADQGLGPVGSSTPYHGEVIDLAVHDDGRGLTLFAGGDFLETGSFRYGNLARLENRAWSVLEGTISAGQYVRWVGRLASSAHGGSPALLVGGRFTSAGGVESHGIAKWGCAPEGPIPGDVNGDGVVNVDDVAPFVAVVLAPQYPLCGPARNADLNGDSRADGRDLAPFVQAVLGG